jgi:hypothetical protein
LSGALAGSLLGTVFGSGAVSPAGVTGTVPTGTPETIGGCCIGQQPYIVGEEQVPPQQPLHP